MLDLGRIRGTRKHLNPGILNIELGVLLVKKLNAYT